MNAVVVSAQTGDQNSRGGGSVIAQGDATASGITATPPASESSSGSAAGGAATVENMEIPSTSSKMGGPIDTIADRMATLISTIDSAGFVSMSKEDLSNCMEIEVLRQQSLSLRVRNEMLQIQNELLDFERKARLENGGHGLPQSNPNNANNEIDSATAMLAFKEELFRKIISVLETEFNCCVCSEVFIEPTVLECGHSFCGTCITTWLQEHRQCPVCRCFSVRPVKHVEMNNFITKIYLMLSDEIRQRRDQQIRDRQTQLADNARRAAANPSAVHSVSISSHFNPFQAAPTFGGPDFSAARDRDDRAAMYRRINDQLVSAYGNRFAIRSRTNRNIMPPQTARRGRHDAHIASGRDRARAITDLNAEYLQQQRILSRFQDLVRRREMEAESRNVTGGPPPPLPTALSRALANIAPIQMQAPLPGSSGNNMSDLIQRARDSAMQTLNLATRLTGLESNNTPSPNPGAAAGVSQPPPTSIGGGGPTAPSSQGVLSGPINLATSTVTSATSVASPITASSVVPSVGVLPPPMVLPSFMEESSLDLGLGSSARSLARQQELPSVDSAASMSTSELRRELSRRGSSWNTDGISFTPRRSARNRIPTAAEIMAQLSDFDSDEDTDIIPME